LKSIPIPVGIGILFKKMVYFKKFKILKFKNIIYNISEVTHVNFNFQKLI